jgi:hypothetical protein
MEALSQLDVHNPDHISVITRDGRITVSVTKDGASVTLGFPVRTPLDPTPRDPLVQQPAPKMMAVKSQGEPKIQTQIKTRTAPIGNCKLTKDMVREIKLMLSDSQTVNSFGSKQQAYEAIARKYNVSYHTISNIHKGLSWRGVKI